MDDLIETSDFLKIATDLAKNQKYLEEIGRLKRENKYRIIMDDKVNLPYMIRYYYLNLRPFARLTIHHLLRSDVDGLHDHPWPFENYIFSGGYWENTQDGRFWRGLGYSAQRSENFYHRLELDPTNKEDTYTLFLMGSKKKEWGFLNDNNQWVQWEEYLKNK